MLPKMEALLVPDTGDRSLLQIKFNNMIVAQKLIDCKDIMDGTYHDVMHALSNAEDDPLFTLADKLSDLLADALESIESSLPDEYERVVKLRTEMDNEIPIPSAP